jgi:hypothetical protein
MFGNALHAITQHIFAAYFLDLNVCMSFSMPASSFVKELNVLFKHQT